ncbi:hypothetical protein [Rickettsia endosymbiont of Culicoides newsteadi]|uniref:hypothetical protein n=1 Tax=Rickettsia endosymbiont of Culicoides newsteadi TaxID=1961830 RepID=UPI000B9AD81F|nr:hypothetical protein [Rickettsia endosymbiont of Culicoides newsteadi]OZG31872.1 hypothetical protein RiCNE_07180 [Rickettsia endosymbiont of Culicoides newsteadi]
MILTGFQLRASRKALNLYLEQLSQNTGVSKVTLMRLEKNTANLALINCTTKNAQILYNYFTQNNLLFIDQHTITLNTIIEPKPIENNLTRFQLIVARCALGLTQASLSKCISIKKSVITEYESKINNTYLTSRYSYVDSILQYFHDQGLIFSNNLSVKTTN